MGTLVIALFSVLAAQVSFVAPIALEDENPHQVLQADFTGDGRLDLLTIDLVSANLFRNEGGGRFSAAQPLAKGSPGLGTAVLGDFNKDGKIDIAVLGFPEVGPNSFFLLLNNGDGTFEATTPITTEDSANIILAGDFTGSGNSDVAVLGASIEVFPGTGAGGFGTPQFTALSEAAADAVAADFNGDHKLDIAFGTVNNNSIYIYSGNGDGTFRAGATVSIAGRGYASGLVAADVNGDGQIDLLAGVGTSVAVLIGNGDGTFLTPVTYALPREAASIFFADVNHDGKPDLVVGCSDYNKPAGGAVSVLYGNGDGTFQPAISSLTGTDANTIVAGDYNGDGRVDVAFTQTATTTVVAFGTGGGRFEQAATYRAETVPVQVFAGNFLATGAADIVSAANNSIEIFPSKGDGTFGQPVVTTVKYLLDATGTQADFDGDGLPDIAIAGSRSSNGGPPSDLQVFFGHAGTNLAPGPVYENLPFGITSVAAGDFNQDGVTDLVMASTDPVYSYVVAMGTGGGNFKIGAPVRLPAGVETLAADIGDFNGDGKPDLLLAGDGAYILFGNGDGTFQAPVAIGVPLGGVTAAAAIDLDGDGKLDVIVTGSQVQGNPENQAGQVCVLLGNGDGTFQPAVCSAVGPSPYGMAFADYNSDGKLDVATANYYGAGVSILPGNGDGTFRPAIGFDAGEYPAGVATADFNGDGKPDLVTANSGSNSLSVLLNATKR
jgi:hypothetical protein